ncbi:MAG TPA: glycosyltransferase family 39 protein [Terriglobales bacterium]|nr:glycosyltransferase family 39 protein [Terriglobales bacterium]
MNIPAQARTRSQSLNAREAGGPGALSTQLDTVVDTLERFAGLVESALIRQPWVSILVLSLAFLVSTSIKARRGQLWNDEILTVYVAALPGFDAIWKALAAHVESSPPLFHLVTRASGLTFGWSPVGLRFPAIVGYLTMILCVYFIVRRYIGPLYAAIGALASYLTYAPYYATRARPYGLLLGLTCIALVCWQQASRQRQRWLALMGLCLSLALALGVHYYAVLSFAAIACGELVRTWRTRRIDGLVWAALAIATTPLLLFLPLIRANQVLAQGYFSPATLSHFVESTALFYFPKNGILAAAFVVVASAWILILAREPQPIGTPEAPPAHEVAAWVVLLLAPVAALIAGKLFTGIYHHRYAIVTIIGFSIVLPFILQRLFRNSRAAALTVLLVLVVCFAGWFAVREQAEEETNDVSTGLAHWLRTANVLHLPIVVADPVTYLPLAHNAAHELGDTLVYIPDTKEALHYTGKTSADYNLAGLREIAPLNLPTYSDFTDAHRRFLVLWQVSDLDWIVPKLRDAGAQLRFYDAHGSRLLFLVDLPDTPAPNASSVK